MMKKMNLIAILAILGTSNQLSANFLDHLKKTAIILFCKVVDVKKIIENTCTKSAEEKLGIKNNKV